MLKRLVKEPLVHFLALAAVVFGVYGVLDRSGASKPDEIVITAARVDQLAALFARTWQRPPTAPELKGLIDDYVKEEIFVREALNLGLDKDDTIIRRRLRSKMEFFNDAASSLPAPTNGELAEYLRANPGAFEVEPRFAFEQILLSADRHGDNIARDAAALLETLRRNASINPGELGDATMLPFKLELTGKTSIGQMFGADFAEALEQTKPGQWTGPVKSEFGLHLVRTSEHQAGRSPALAEVRAAVEREWASEKRNAGEDQHLAALLARYRIRIEALRGDPRPATGQ
ncbi:hypothetical protein ES707_03178 [subsurface metagenome]|jgi:hypothetical protein